MTVHFERALERLRPQACAHWQPAAAAQWGWFKVHANLADMPELNFIVPVQLLSSRVKTSLCRKTDKGDSHRKAFQAADC